MCYDDYGRTWEGPYPFTNEMIAMHAPRAFGVYQVLYEGAGSMQVAYIGIATGETIFDRLSRHCRGQGNWALGRISDRSKFTFVYYRCDPETAKQIESHVVTMKKPPFNVKPEYKHFIPSISVH